MRWVWLVAALLAVPSVSAQEAAAVPSITNAEPTPQRLFVHLNGFMDAPMNVEEPPQWWSSSSALGVLTSTTSCLPSPPGLGLVGQSFHTRYAYLARGSILYSSGEGEPRYTPDRGLARDLELDADVPIVLRWFLETQATATDLPDGGAAPIPVPRVVLRATLRQGEDIALEDAGFNSGPVVARGQTEPALLMGSFTQGATYEQLENGHHLYGFELRLGVEGNLTVPAAEGLNLRVDTFMDVPVCDPEAGSVMANTVREHSSAGHRPTLDLGVRDPLRVERFQPQRVLGDMVLHATLSSVWGSYDIRDVHVQVEGPGQPEVTLAMDSSGYGHHHAHGAPDVRDLAWVWNATHVPKGLYQATLQAGAIQGNATARAVALADTGTGRVAGCSTGPDGHVLCVDLDGVSRAAPTLAVPALLAALALLAAARRRRP